MINYDFFQVEDCDTPADCQGGSGCCNGYCCEQRYFQQYKALPCITHLACQDLGLGEYCCPDKQGNGTSACCDANPNLTPPPPKNVTAGAPGDLKRTRGSPSLQGTTKIIAYIVTITCFFVNIFEL